MTSTPYLDGRLRHPFYLDGEGINRPPGPDKHRWYAEFAADGPGVVPIVREVAGEPTPAWLVCRYADVREVLRRQDVFSRTAAADVDPVDVSGTMLGMDGPQHARVRGSVKDAFTPAAVAGLRDRVAAEARAQLAVLTGRGRRGDLIADFALPFTLHVICDLLGLPPEDRLRFRRWGDDFLADGGVPPEQVARSSAEMAGYLWEQVERRRGCPADDLMTRIAVEAGDQPVDVQVKLPIALVVGGWETTAGSIGTFTYLLCSRPYGDHPTGWAYLREHPERLDSAVAELERLYSTSNADELPRRVTADVELPSGFLLRAGEVVVPSHDAANRDPRVFPDPERVDFTRDPNPHLSFGHGPHRCIGAHLGALEVRVALRLLLRELPGLRLAVPPEQIRWKAGHVVLGPEEIPVQW
ncbi:cytochrome P450 [Micromonospora fluostatini]